MTKENAVEANAGEVVKAAASQEEVNNNASNASGVHSEDLLDVLAAKDEELKKIQNERDNYKRGLLKHKGKLDDSDDSDPEDLDTKVSRMVEDKLLASREVQILKEKDEAIKELARKNKELTTALQNRSQISSGVSSGSSEDTAMKVPDNILSTDQIRNLKAKGWDDAKIETFKKNLMKNRG